MANYPPAIQRRTNKHGYKNFDTLDKQGLVGHSMEGSLAAAFGELDNPTRMASWHFSVAKNGDVYQHIDTDNISWANGSYDANRRFWSIEHEGVAGEPLTDAQQASTTALMGWLLGLAGLRAERRFSCWEHNEMTAYGASPTACPSGRIPWAEIIQDIEGDDMGMTPEEKADFDNLLAHVNNLTAQFQEHAATEPNQQAHLDTLTEQFQEHAATHGGAHTHEVEGKAV